MQLVLPLDVSFLVSNTLTVPEHNQQLLEMASAGAAIVVTAWEPAAVGDAGQQAAVDFISGIIPHARCDLAYKCLLAFPCSAHERFNSESGCYLFHH